MTAIGLQGGFGEKGRTSVSVHSASTAVMLDAGIMVGARGEDYYPTLLGPIEGFDALFVSHAHEDHIGALPWLLKKGFGGKILMTEETRAEAAATLEQYAEPVDLARFPLPLSAIEIFRPGDAVRVGDLTVHTGRSGHVVGGVWFAVDASGQTIVYCADVVPESSVFCMDTPPPCDLLILDASYGGDPVPGSERARQISKWVRDNAGGCLLPTPLSGRSLELMKTIETPFAIEAGMRKALQVQIRQTDALHPGVAEILGDRLSNASDWCASDTLPACPLLVDDGMGVAGPSREAIPRADAGNYPILLTGHLPKGSPGAELMARGRAAWVRMPTHPTAPENIRLWEACGRPKVLGHSCAVADLESLKAHLPSLATDHRTGEKIVL